MNPYMNMGFLLPTATDVRCFLEVQGSKLEFLQIHAIPSTKLAAIGQLQQPLLPKHKKNKEPKYTSNYPRSLGISVHTPTQSTTQVPFIVPPFTMIGSSHESLMETTGSSASEGPSELASYTMSTQNLQFLGFYGK